MKYKITISACILIVISLGIFSQLKSSVNLPDAEQVVIYQEETVVKELSGEEAQLFLMQLETVKPYFFKNASVEDYPQEAEIVYKMVVGEEVFYIYDKNGSVHLMKPYDYTVELPSSLDIILE
ncbi:hypothetical protein [Streptococcus oriscaviae]|uniref:Uncharacterized protein n=1 Tax=Streptococcus oriscaviae TaxID=2781599 RepID=A0ABX7YMZ1_9STRE|nr:hypothetical protein [Streptococcus oriscaviae]QUE54594.1 hypothetical protein INT76_01510 [Streptococcus oriscaviae]